MPTLTGTDVGFPSMGGSVTVTQEGGKNVYEVVGGGGDIWGTSDNFYYAYFKATGNFDYVVKVASHIGNSGDGGWSKAELMARLDDGSGVPQGGDPFIANMATRPSADTANGAPAGVNFRGPQWRAERDGNCSWTSPSPGYPPNANSNWLRLERVGNVFYMYTSDDGKAWNMYNPYSPQGWDTAGSWPPGTDNPDVSDFTTPWPNTILLGLAVTAHNDADVSTVKFTDFAPYTATPVAITTQPAATVSVPQNNKLTLSVAATGDPVHYQWMKDGKAVARAVAPTYTVNLAQLSDAGKYTCKVFNGSSEVVSGESVVTVTVDTQAPTLLSITPDASFTALRLEFSEPVSDTALTAGNYKLDQGVTVSAVSRITASMVVLTTSKMGEGVSYNLTVNGVKDTASPANTIAADTKIAFKSFVFDLGMASYERWENANGDPGAITDIVTAIADGTMRPADVSFAVTQFGGPWGATDNYASRISGYFIPPSNGNYVFFLASDDQSNLYLSTDENPANKKLIAQESGWSNQYQWQTIGGSSLPEDKRSDTFGMTEWETGGIITLQAGKRYFMEILHDEGGGGDGADATFIKEGDADPAQSAAGMFLKGSVIGTYINPNGANVTFTEQPKSVTISQNTTATLKVAATGTSVYGTTVNYQWQRAAKGSTAFADVSGGTSTSYITPALALADDGVQFRVIARVPAFAATSAVAVVTVTTDAFPPKVASVGALGGAAAVEIGVQFDEPVTEASAAAAANYSVSAGTITGVKFYAKSPGAVLTVTGLTVGNEYSVTVKDVVDLFGNKMAATTKSFKVSSMKWGVVGANEQGIGNGVVAVGRNGFDVYSDGVTEWGTYDEATFVYEEITGDFDKKVRVEFQDNSSQWARAGLIVRDVTNFGVDRAAQDGGAAGRYQKVHVNPVLTAMGTGGNNSWEGNRRLETGAATTSAGGGGVPQYPNAWCRLQRQGDVFTIYRSDDGKTWTQLGQTTFTEPMPAKVFVGPEFSPENGNISDEALKGMFVAKFRDYSDTFAPDSSKRTYGIGLNFGADEVGGGLAATAAAGVPGVVQANWNNINGASGSTNAIVAVKEDNSTEATSVTVFFTSANLWSSTGPRGENNNLMTGADLALMTGYLDTGNATTSTVTISNLPPALTGAGYDLYVYALGGVAGRGGAYRVVDASSGAVLKDYLFVAGPTNPATYMQAAVSVDKANPGFGNYLMFTGLTAANITLQATTAGGLGYSGTPRAPINAVQLITPTTGEIEAGAPECSVARAAGGIVITFTGSLESADVITGPWSPVAGSSPLTVPTTGAAKFYRAKQ